MMNDLLLVIDMQNVYTKGQKWECVGIENVAENIRNIILSKKCDKVIFTRYISAKTPKGNWRVYNHINSDVNKNEWVNEIVPQLREISEQNPVYSKNVYSSLAVSEIYKAACDADRVIITGVVAECCVLSTIFQLVDAGIEAVYLTEGVASSCDEKKKAVQLIVEGLSPLHVKIMSVEKYLHQG